MKKVFAHENSTIHFQVSGSGLPVLLLHGFGEDSSIWDTQVKFLQQYCQVIVPDLPGSGNSSLLQNENKAISIEDYASCINDLLIHEKISKCVMLGHSMGGYITLAFAEKHSGNLLGYGLVHSTAYADSDDKKANRKKTMDVISNEGSYAFLKESIPTLFSTTFSKQAPETVNGVIENGRSFSKDALLQYTEAMMNRQDKTDVLKSSEVPVLFILGTEDVAAPLNDVLEQVHLPGVSYIHILEKVGHMGMLEATEQVNNHLLNFIRSIESE